MARHNDSSTTAERDLVLSGEEARELLDQLFADNEDLDDDDLYSLRVTIPEKRGAKQCHAKYVRPLAEALQREEVGELERGPGPKSRDGFCTIELIVCDLDAGIECVQRTLQQAGAPPETTIRIDDAMEVGLFDDGLAVE